MMRAYSLIFFLLSVTIVIQAQTAPMTNDDVIALTKAGLDNSLILDKVRSSKTNFDLSTPALIKLKEEGVAEAVISLMIQLGATPIDQPTAEPRRRLTDELTSYFHSLRDSSVTVWSEFGHGTGFIFDESGLVMTNQHVIGPSEYIAVQFDKDTKIQARVLAASPEKDIAILWIDLSALPASKVAKISVSADSIPTLVEGERVFTIGSPLNQRKIITTGIASKIEERAILSDININPGNSGGALFNSLGEVVGITTFGDITRSGPGVSGIVRIEEAIPLIAEAKEKMASTTRPESRLLRVDPSDTFPIDAIKDIAVAKKFDTKPYAMTTGDFNLVFLTPTLKYRMQTEAEREAAKTRDKRNKKEGAVKGTFRPFDDFYAWREYVGEYKPILIIRATPQLGESFWGAVGRGLAANYGIHTRARLRFKTDFYRMKLYCGSTEVEPIHPAKIAHLLSESNYFVTVKDATFEGMYSYPADAINAYCGTVKLHVYSEKEPDKPKIRELSAKSISAITSDFAPYFQSKVRP